MVNTGTGLDIREEYILSALKDIAYTNGKINEQGQLYFFVSRQELAKRLGLSKPTIIKSLRILAECGKLKEQKVTGEKKPRLFLITDGTNSDGETRVFHLTDTEQEIIRAYRKHCGSVSALIDIHAIIMGSIKEQTEKEMKVINITEYKKNNSI